MCGWTWAEIDAFTLPRFYMLCAYWRKHPPTHRILAAVHGLKPDEPEEKGNLADLAAMFGAGPLQG